MCTSTVFVENTAAHIIFIMLYLYTNIFVENTAAHIIFIMLYLYTNIYKYFRAQ